MADTGKWITTTSGRLQQIRVEETKKVPTKAYEKKITEETPVPPSTPLATPIISDPAGFIKNMKASWDKCEEMRLSGNSSKEEVGWAFYLAMKELFGKYK